jgi:hypothetical protein
MKNKNKIAPQGLSTIYMNNHENMDQNTRLCYLQCITNLPVVLQINVHFLQQQKDIKLQPEPIINNAMHQYYI